MKQITTLVLVVLWITGFCQPARPIIKAQAFYSEHMPGTVPRDLEGKPVQAPDSKTYTVYIETKAEELQVTRVWVGNKCFAVTPLVRKEKMIAIGKRKSDGQGISLEAGRGNHWVLLELSPLQPCGGSPCVLKPTELLVVFEATGKASYFKIAKAVELVAPEYP